MLSRRIEHASLEVTGAHIRLPLPPLALGGSGSAATEPTPGPNGPPPVELVSIDEITLSDVQITSGGRTLRGDIEVVPRSDGGLDVRKVSLAADDTTIEITGTITDLSRPAGELALKAGSLDFDALMAFLSDFSTGASAPAAPATASDATAAVDPTASLRAAAPAEAPAIPTGIDIALTVDADRASFGDLVLNKVSGKARLTPAGLTLDPIAFGVFGGQYDGSLALTLADPPAFTLDAKLAGVDMASVMTFAGTPGLVTGTMAGTLALKGSGTTADDVLKTARGTAHVDLANGTVKGLGLVRGVVLATSMRQDSQGALGSTSVDEPFTSLSGTLNVANGTANTTDLAFESKDLSLAANGSVALDGSAVNVKGQVLLSEELSAQAGRDFQRIAAEQGRIRLPATIDGSAEALQVRIDVGDMAKRAITNKANEEAGKIIERNLPKGVPRIPRIPGGH